MNCLNQRAIIIMYGNFSSYLQQYTLLNNKQASGPSVFKMTKTSKNDRYLYI